MENNETYQITCTRLWRYRLCFLGSKKVIDVLKEELEQKGLAPEVKIVETGCHGFCEMGPIMIIYPEGTRSIVGSNRKISLKLLMFIFIKAAS